jgi:hypothetical protein
MAKNDFCFTNLAGKIARKQTGSFVKDKIKQESTRYKYDRWFEIINFLMVLIS